MEDIIGTEEIILSRTPIQSNWCSLPYASKDDALFCLFCFGEVTDGVWVRVETATDGVPLMSLAEAKFRGLEVQNV